MSLSSHSRRRDLNADSTSTAIYGQEISDQAHWQNKQNQCERKRVSKTTTHFAFSKFSVTSKKLPNVYKSCSKMISLENLKILPKNVGDLSKLIVAKGFEKLPKVQ